MQFRLESGIDVVACSEHDLQIPPQQPVHDAASPTAFDHRTVEPHGVVVLTLLQEENYVTRHAEKKDRRNKPYLRDLPT